MLLPCSRTPQIIAKLKGIAHKLSQGHSLIVALSPGLGRGEREHIHLGLMEVEQILLLRTKAIGVTLLPGRTAHTRS